MEGGKGGRQGVRGQTSQTQSLGHDKSCLHTGPLQRTGAALCWKKTPRLKVKTNVLRCFTKRRISVEFSKSQIVLLLY